MFLNSIDRNGGEGRVEVTVNKAAVSMFRGVFQGAQSTGEGDRKEDFQHFVET